MNQYRVSNPPPKPLMIWDGDCHFCKRWIERWREMTAGKVDYATSQEVGNRFPEIAPDEFKRAVCFIEPDGQTFFAAEAVYRSLQYRSSKRWLVWSYDHIPGFAAISEFGYKLIASNRATGSIITRLLWGDDVRPPTYFWARTWFLRMLGVVYLCAFISFWVQIDGLIGADGVLPINQLLPAAHNEVGSQAYLFLPTLCWLNSSNGFLHLLCGAGVAFSLLLIVGLAPVLSLIALFLFYLSLATAGQTFFSFQWDILLLETGFLSVFFAPWKWWLGSTVAINKPALFLLKFLLFKLMLMSGVETDKRGLVLVEPDRAGLSLLVTTAAHSFCLVGRSTSGVVQKILGRILSDRRNCCTDFHLGAATAAIDRRRAADFFADRHCRHRQLLLFQFVNHRALLASD
jgi:predicted DCC family thiol-disulfide oxidoreductase YuxK